MVDRSMLVFGKLCAFGWLGLVTWTVGCTSVPGPDIPDEDRARPSESSRDERVAAELLAAKKASLEDWPDPEALEGFAVLTSLLLVGTDVDSVRIRSKPRPGGGLLWAFSLEDAKTLPTGNGSAVPVTKDGYFLTARHCLEGEDKQVLVTLVWNGESFEMKKGPARLVWASEETDDLDLALIHAPIRTEWRYSFAEVDSLKRKDRVGATGWSGLGRTLAGYQPDD